MTPPLNENCWTATHARNLPEKTAERRETYDRAERTGQRPLIWTQIGVHSPEAKQLADEAGLPYVANRCLMVDHAALR